MRVVFSRVTILFLQNFKRVGKFQPLQKCIFGRNVVVWNRKSLNYSFITEFLITFPIILFMRENYPEILSNISTWGP